MAEEITRLLRVKRSRSGGQPAPHKPLLILALLVTYGRLSERMVPFAEVEATAKKLAKFLGTKTPSFKDVSQRLVTDSVWEESVLGQQKSEKLVGLPMNLYREVQGDRANAIKSVLDAYFDRGQHGALFSEIAGL